MSDLAKKIRQRKEQAANRKIGDHAEFVARILGETSEKREHPPLVTVDTKTSVFENSDFHITHEHEDVYDNDGGGAITDTITIAYQSKIVFKAENVECQAYVPGPWEKKLNAFFALASAKNTKDEKKAANDKQLQQREEQRQESARRRKRLIEDWGI